MKKFFLLLVLFIFYIATINGQTPKTYLYALKDTNHLYMDVFQPINQRDDKTCILFVFGGGFTFGERSASYNTEFFKMLIDKGFTLITIDYRLGLKNVHNVGPFHIKPLVNAIDMAVDDLFSATDYMLKHADELKINPSHIVLCGCSAGAITVLQADYELGNRRKSSVILPDSFHFAGVISFAGAIFSHHGKINYKKHAPAPTFLLHGTKDNVVKYNQIQCFRIGFFGTNALVKRFEKYHYPYYAIRYRNIGHEVASEMKNNVNQIVWFIDNYVIFNKQLQIDQYYFNPEIKRNPAYPVKPNEIYRKKNKKTGLLYLK